MPEGYSDEGLQVSDNEEIETYASQIGSDDIQQQLSISYRSAPSPTSEGYQPSTRRMSTSTWMDRSISSLLKSRLPNKTLILHEEHTWSNHQCPLRKGIIYYRRHNIIYEHDLYSSSKHEPRIVANFAPTSMVKSFQIVPIKCNRILVIEKCFDFHDDTWHYPHLSIHEIRSYRVGPALWTYHNYGYSNISELRLIKSTTNTLGITFGLDSKSHMELFDISGTGNKKDYPLIEAGRFNYNRQLDDGVVLSPDRRILLNLDRNSETIDIVFSGSGDINNMEFSSVTSMLIPNPNDTSRGATRLSGGPLLAFSADGSKFAVATADGVVSVWDVRSKIPLKVYVVEVSRLIQQWPISLLQFSSGILGREVLVFMEEEISTLIKIVHIIDATSFETEETLRLPRNRHFYRGNGGTSTLFFDPSGGSMYASLEGTLYEWDLREKEGPEWWLGEE